MRRSSVPKSVRRSLVEDTVLLNVVQRYFKLAGLASAVWLAGYLHLSVSWLWLILVVYVWKEKHNRTRLYKKHVSRDIARDEKEVILARVDDLPSWVNFPDVERAEWVNKMLRQMWPYIGEMVEKILRQSVEQSIVQSLPPSLQSFKFSRIDLGNNPPRIGGVKVYTQVKRDEIYMDLELNYSGDSNIEVTIKGIAAGIKNLRLHGTLRVVFKPLINRLPLIGGMLVFFLNNPELDFDFTSLANALELPGLSDILHSSIQEQISNFMVLPNRYPIKMVEGLDLNKLRYPQPQGVVRIRVIEAKDLIQADIGLTGMGKSDPYCKIRVGAKQFKTKVIQNSLCPVWDETFELIVDSADGQLLYIDVFDEDPGIMHDDLGSISLDLHQLKETGYEDEWFPLEEVKSGMIHVQLTWLWLANQANELDRVVDGLKDEDTVHVAILMVYLDSARNLPRGKKSMSEPSARVVLTVGQQVEESMIKYSTSEPRWEQNFRFLLHNPNYQNMDVEVVDGKSKKLIGHTVIKMKQLLEVEDMVMDQKFRVKTSNPDSCIQLRLCLRILTPNFNADYIDDLEVLIPETAHLGTAVDSPSKLNVQDLTRPPQPNPPDPQYGSSVDGFTQHYATASATQQTDGSRTTNGTVTGHSNSGQTLQRADSDAPPSPEPSFDQPALRQRMVAGTQLTGSHGLGRLQMTLRYSPPREKLIVVVHKCINLKPIGDGKNVADPYVKLYLLPDKSSASKRRTQVCKDSLNPVFDETCEYTLAEADISKRQLWVSVKNDVNLFSLSKTEMGQVLVDLRSLDINRAVTEWFDLCPENSLQPTLL
ncbi:hypothetical protein BsWGS_25490 [Bradybaena similaris]